jgi:hypothetical protein
MSNCKIYADSDLNNRLPANQNSIILTPAKKEKGQKILGAADDIYSYLVSKVRQPLNLCLTGLPEKTQIQFGQRVRSEKGLLVHVWHKGLQHKWSPQPKLNKNFTGLQKEIYKQFRLKKETGFSCLFQTNSS